MTRACGKEGAWRGAEAGAGSCRGEVCKVCFSAGSPRGFGDGAANACTGLHPDQTLGERGGVAPARALQHICSRVNIHDKCSGSRQGAAHSVLLSARGHAHGEEAALLARRCQTLHLLDCRHPNVVCLKNVYEDKSNVCLVMEVRNKLACLPDVARVDLACGRTIDDRCGRPT